MLRQPYCEEFAASKMDRKYLAHFVRSEIQSLRKRLLDCDAGDNEIEFDEASIALAAVERAKSFLSGGLRRVINATGVVLNTNLGRSPLPISVLEDMTDVGQGYSSLEIDVNSGKRGDRTKKISELLNILSGAESSIVVNNNASAVMLVVSALSKKKEVVVSRSELVEIGGSFRLPDVIESAGGILKEVGTTNKTRATDFENAISDKTGMLLRCHRSNFEIVGFTEDASYEDLVKIAKKHKVPLVDDLGSGAFYDVSKFGLEKETTVKEVIDTGVDIVTFSGDKLLGGPQAGIIAGSKEYVSRVRKSPMYRALRADKLILSLIENTLSLYLSNEPEKYLPMFALCMVQPEEIKARVDNFISSLSDNVKNKLDLEVISTSSTMGGGSMPGETMESFGLKVRCKSLDVSSAKIAAMLREANPPVISTVQKESVILDFRTVLERDESPLAASFESICKNL